MLKNTKGTGVTEIGYREMVKKKKKMMKIFWLYHYTEHFKRYDNILKIMLE